MLLVIFFLPTLAWGEKPPGITAKTPWTTPHRTLEVKKFKDGPHCTYFECDEGYACHVPGNEFFTFGTLQFCQATVPDPVPTSPVGDTLDSTPYTYPSPGWVTGSTPTESSTLPQKTAVAKAEPTSCAWFWLAIGVLVFVVLGLLVVSPNFCAPKFF